MRQEIGQMREIAYDLHLKKQRFHQEFLDFMNDNIDDSNQAPQEPVLNYARLNSDMSAGSQCGQGDQALAGRKLKTSSRKCFKKKRDETP